MSDKTKGLSKFWAELRRRKVLRSLAIYAGTAFIILEAATIIFPRWDLPDWTIDLVLWLLILGAVVNVFVAWFFDLTAEGLQRTQPAAEVIASDRRPESKGWKTATLLSLVVIVALIVLNIAGGAKQLKSGDIQSLLVLPFDNYTGDDRLDYVAAGMHSSLIGDMGQISGLRIISKTTASMYKNMELSLPEMATELNADAVVEPTVMCYGDSICVQIRIITPFPEEKQLWIGEYKEEKSQILNLYNRVSKQIAEEIKVTLTPIEEESLAQSKIVNTDAYDAYLMGQYYWGQLTPEALQLALEYFNLAIELDPGWSPPYSGVATYWIAIRQMGLAPSSFTIPNIYKYLNKAIEMDPNSALTHYTSAIAAISAGYDWKKGEQEFLKVIELNPNHAENHAYYAHLLLFLRRHEEALTQAQVSLSLDPLNPLIQGLVAVVLMHAGNYNEAILLANKIIPVVPNHPLAIGVLWGSNEALGNYEESLEHCLKLFALDELSSENIRSIYKAQGYQESISEIIRLAESIPEEQIPVSADIRIALLYLSIDEVDKCLSILERRLEVRGPDLPYAATGIERLKRLESEPRFLAILDRMNLPLPV